MLKQDQGLVIVYTGDGKGKTTAALGLILRSLGYKKKVLLVQFGKVAFSGELKILEKLQGLKLIRGGKGFVGILGDKLPLEEHKKAARKTMEILEREVKSGKWDLVIADEILGALAGRLIGLKSVMEFLESKPDDVYLVLTGRNAPQEIIKMADLVTEMKEVKHPFKKGVIAKKGIDY